LAVSDLSLQPNLFFAWTCASYDAPAARWRTSYECLCARTPATDDGAGIVSEMLLLLLLLGRITLFQANVVSPGRDEEVNEF
jgi:hypothetical protein